MTAKRRWTQEEHQLLRELYPTTFTAELAARMGRSVKSLYAMAKISGMHKNPAWLRENCRNITTETGLKTRFQPGLIPHNKGVKGWAAGGRAAATQFRKGDSPCTWRPIGTEVLDDDGYRKRKVRDDAPPGMSRKNWRYVHVLLWEEHHGPVPPGHNVQFANRDRTDIQIDNLELVPRRVNMARNTVHNLPPPLLDVVRAKAVLTRIINDREGRRGKEQDRRPA